MAVSRSQPLIAGMGNSESNPIRNMDKRQARRTYHSEFSEAIRLYRTSDAVAAQHAALAAEMGGSTGADGSIRVCVRKRPIHKEELKGLEFDVVSSAHGKVVAVHDARMHSNFRSGSRRILALDASWR